MLNNRNFKWRKKSSQWVLVADERYKIYRGKAKWTMVVPNRGWSEGLPQFVEQLSNEQTQRRSTLNLSKYCIEYLYLNRITRRLAA